METKTDYSTWVPGRLNQMVEELLRENNQLKDQLQAARIERREAIDAYRKLMMGAPK